MKKLIGFIGFIAVDISLIGIVYSALQGYNEYIWQIGLYSALLSLGLLLSFYSLMLTPKQQRASREHQLSDAMVAHHRNLLIQKMNAWDKDLEEEEIEYLKELRGEA